MPLEFWIGIGLVVVGVIIFCWIDGYSDADGFLIVLVFVGLVLMAIGGASKVWPHMWEDNRTWVQADQLANEKCASRGGIDGSPGGSASGRARTDHWLIVCRDGTAHEIPNGEYREETK